MNEQMIQQEVAGAVARLSARDRQLRDEHQAAVKRRGRIAAALEPTDALVRNMHALVDLEHAKWVIRNTASILTSFSGGLAAGGRPKAPKLWRYEGGPLGSFDVADLCGLVPDLVKQSFEQVIRAAGAVEKGIPLEKRAEALAAEDATIAHLEDLHTNLVDQAAALTPPIIIALLPAVQARRNADAARLQRDQAEIAARQRAEAAINADVPRGTPSAYLARNRIDRTER